MRGELRPAAGAHDEHLVGRQASRPRRSARRCPRTPGGACRPDRRRTAPAGAGPASRRQTYCTRLPRKRLGGRVLLGPARHVHLAEEHQALAFAVFHQRAVLQAVAAVEDRQEVAAGRLLDQHRGHVAAVAAAPDARHLDAAPLDRRPAVACGWWCTSAAAAGASPRRASRGGVSPSSPASSGWSGTRGKTCRRPYSATRKPNRFSSTSAVCSNTTTFSPSRTRPTSGAGPVRRQRPLADDEHVVAGEVRVGLDRLAFGRPAPPAACAVSPFGSNSAILRGRLRRRRARHHVDREACPSASRRC